jgi:plasmid stabilization system protein ParE
VTFTVRLHPAAVDELRAARDWYDDAAPGVGVEFVDEFRRVIDRLREWPTSAPRRPVRGSAREIRQASLRRFPYHATYEVRGDTLLIVAVAHGRRRPGYWRERLKG